MIITDKKVLKMLKKLDSYEVEESLLSYPEDERDGRSDMEMLLDEAEYFYELYSDDGSQHYNDLKDARRLLRETDHGKCIPIDIYNGFKPKYGYYPSDIEYAKRIVNEYNRLKRLVNKLKAVK
jgi:hypothetical protein